MKPGAGTAAGVLALQGDFARPAAALRRLGIQVAGCLTALGAYLFSANVVWALVGGLFFLSLPIIVKLSITVYVDLGLIFFSTASILSLLKWIESRYQSKFLILSATCCGLALGTKYNGLMAFTSAYFFDSFSNNFKRAFLALYISIMHKIIPRAIGI